MRPADFDYTLPPELVAQRPAPARDASRLLVLHRRDGHIEHENTFRGFLKHLRGGDVLVLNDSRVIPARLRGQKLPTGGEIEILLVSESAPNQWWTLLRPGKRVRVGTRIVFAARPVRQPALEAIVVEKNSEGHCLLEFDTDQNIRDLIEGMGEVPLPPYVDRGADDQDRERYQTVFAHENGSVAAPTAGLHFTQDLLHQIQELGVEIHFVTLHVGLGTFAPVKAQEITSHAMHEEEFILNLDTARAINNARAAGRRIIAVGTTTVRVLESVALAHEGTLVGTRGRTSIFIYPPFNFQVVDGLLTNFHLPRSTLLMLVSAFAAPGELRGKDMVLSAYAEAVRLGYRFFSYGDAMLIV